MTLGHAKDVGGCSAERPKVRGETRKASILPQLGLTIFCIGGADADGGPPASVNGKGGQTKPDAR